MKATSDTSIGRATVFFVDDHTILREGLKLIFSNQKDFEVVGEAGNAEDALPLIKSLEPQLLILDISLPGKTGLELTNELRKLKMKSKIILLSRHDQSEYIQEAKKSGVQAYVLKDEAGKDLLDAARSVLRGYYYLSPRLMSGKGNDFIPDHDLEENDSDLVKTLTNKEKEILQLIGQGKDNQSIADDLKIQIKTVRIHRQNIMDKLEIHKAEQLILFALKNSREL
ncbi:MAG: response regulator transcription factor [Leptospira sp.]|nr:response regulator transcription factor [Leptospira sp.]